MFKYLLSILLLVVLGAGQSQNTIDTFFTKGELAALEELVSLSNVSNSSILLAKQGMSSAQAELAIGNQLLGALTVSAGASVAGDFYGQVAPSYSFTLGVDIIELIQETDRTVTMGYALSEARASNRVALVQAFTSWKVAIEQAKNASAFLEAVSLTNQLVVHKLKVGDATQSDVTRAISDLSGAKISLLQANANVIVSLENLALITGSSPDKTLDTIQSVMLAHGEDSPVGAPLVAER